MIEDFKVVSVVKFNDGEALVLNRPIEFVYDIDPKDGKSFIGVDGPFRDFLGYSCGCGMKAFAGRELTLKMADGSTKKIKDYWWQTCKKGYTDITVKDVEGLKRCYVFHGASITLEDLEILRVTYTGQTYAYYDYEKIIKYDSERKLWIGKFCDEQQKVRGIQKKSQAIVNLMVGRSMLLRAVNHLIDILHPLKRVDSQHHC